jgi:hypothetical protein
MPERFHDDAEVLAYMCSTVKPVSARELRGLSAEERMGRALELIREGNVFPADMGLEEVRWLVEVFKLNLQAMFDYTPRAYGGRLVFFRTTDRRPVDPPHPERSWVELAAEGIELYTVPGNHMTMMVRPQVQVLGGAPSALPGSGPEEVGRRARRHRGCAPRAALQALVLAHFTTHSSWETLESAPGGS